MQELEYYPVLAAWMQLCSGKWSEQSDTEPCQETRLHPQKAITDEHHESLAKPQVFLVHKNN